MREKELRKKERKRQQTNDLDKGGGGNLKEAHSWRKEPASI